jgi:hypothetical protein
MNSESMPSNLQQHPPEQQEFVYNLSNKTSFSFNEQTFQNWINLFSDDNSSEDLMLKSIQDLSLNLEVSLYLFYSFVIIFLLNDGYIFLVNAITSFI